MLIKNGTLFSGDCTFNNGDLSIEGKYIAKVNDIVEFKTQRIHEEVIDATDLYVIPGLIDTHIHGVMGHDFCEANHEGLDIMCSYLAKQGITSFMPTSMTLDEEKLLEIYENFGTYQYKQGARPVGIHMEGPFFEEAKKGAQSSTYLRDADYELYRRLQEASNHQVKIVSLSPVVEGALSFIEKAKGTTSVSLAHSSCQYELASKAFEAGVRRVTHLYNAMLPFGHREPGIIGAAFDQKEVMVELICDGYHIHPSMIRSSFAMYTDERVILVSDNMMATGMPDGEYELGGQKVWVSENKATLEDGTIAGSVTNLMTCMKRAVAFGIPLESAVKTVTINPAKSIGLEKQIGSLEEGKIANIVLLDKKLDIKGVIIEGKLQK